MKLREIRKSQNLSVPELSRLSGVPVRTIEDIESLGISLGQLVDFLNRHRRPDELYYIHEHWLENLLAEFGFVSRYQLEQLGGPRQNTTANWLERRTPFKNVSAEQIDKLVFAICNLDPKYDYGGVLHKLFDEYLEKEED